MKKYYLLATSLCLHGVVLVFTAVLLNGFEPVADQSRAGDAGGKRGNT